MKNFINLNNREKRKKGWKFWLFFWLVAVLFLTAWFFFWQYKNYGLNGILKIGKPLVRIAPINSQDKREILTIFDVFSEITKDKKEKTFLLLFQNNLEIRPGGGFIGSFGILKIKGEKITHIDVHDTNVFDSRIVSEIDTPYPMAQTINIKSWELRDSNWSPDFPTNAEKADFFYHLEGGEEKFDGVVALSTDLLPSFLEITGPIVVQDYPGEYNSENAIAKLEYQVEKGYKEQGIEKGKRKYIMKSLASAIMHKIGEADWTTKKKILERIKKHLDNRDVMVYFKNQDIQNRMEFLGWGGEIKNFDKDYLMLVDANLGALKTDFYMKRSFEYTIDLSQEKPLVNLKVIYKNTARARDWMTSDYLTYLRAYVPEESWFSTKNKEVVYGKEQGKKYVGKIVEVPINGEKTVEFIYELPEEMKENYNLLIQKQSGVGELPGKVILIQPDKTKKQFEFILNSEWKLK